MHVVRHKPLAKTLLLYVILLAEILVILGRTQIQDTNYKVEKETRRPSTRLVVYINHPTNPISSYVVIVDRNRYRQLQELVFIDS